MELRPPRPRTLLLPPRRNLSITNIGGSPNPEPVVAITETQFQAHLDDLTPHPAYDDMQSLTLIYENELI